MRLIEVLQVVSAAYRRGSEVFAVDLHEALVRRGRTVRTVALAADASGESLDLPILGPSRLAAATLRALRAEIGRARVVVAHGATTLPACAAAGVGTGIPFIYRSIGDPLYWADTPARRLRVRLYLRRSRAVTALWSGSATALSQRLGVRQDKIRIIPNGVPAARCPLTVPAARPGARLRLGLSPELPTVAYVGALSGEKNVAAAIRAVSALPDCQLLIVGDGPQRQELVRLAAALGGRVRFRGSTNAPAEALAAADAVVLPSLSEGMPGVLIEAGLSGLPAVATAVGGVAEIVVPGRTGALVPPGDVQALTSALRQVLAFAEPYGRAARAHCLARFEIAVVAAAWDALLAEVLGPRHLLKVR